MNAMKQTHSITLPTRTITITVEERENEILFTLLSSAPEPAAGREPEIRNWLDAIMAPFDHDHRPTRIVSLHNGTTTHLSASSDGAAVCVVEPMGVN